MTAESGGVLQTALLGAALLLPWLLLLVLPLAPAAARRRFLPFAAVPALLAALLLPEGIGLVVPLLPAGLSFAMDATARAFLLPAALIWVLAAWMAVQLRPAQTSTPSFGALWLLALAGNLALILAQDLLALYTGFALMSFAALGLVVFERTPQALSAGRLYLAMMLVAEVALFVAVVALVAGAQGDTRFDAVTADRSGPILALLALAFGLKLGVLGLHSWLPRAHPVAPVAASAVLSGVLIKSGILGWLRLVEPNGDAFAPVVVPLLVGLGVAGAFYGVLRGLLSQDPKVLLGWSSVSQVGLVTVLAGLALQPGAAGGAAIAAIAVFVLHHGLAKAALFLGVGLLGVSRGRRRRGVWIALWLPALALAAAPGTSGVLAKAALDLAVAAAEPGRGVTALLYLTSVASALLMLRFLSLTRRRPAPDPAEAPAETAEAARPGRHRELPWILLLGSVVFLPWFVFRGTPMFAAAATGSEQLAAFVPPIVALLMAGVAARWPVATRLGTVYEDSVSALTVRATTMIESFPAAVRLAHWERRLHTWRRIGQLVVLVTVALGAAIGYGLAF